MNIHKAGMLRFATIDLQLVVRAGTKQAHNVIRR